MVSALKLPLGQTLNQIAIGRAQDAIQLMGKALPASVVVASGTIVTVKFELNSIYTLPNVRMPLIGSEYARPPIQPGCQGVVFPADAYLGGMSGLGGGVADLTQHANLSTLVFFPIGNTGFQAVDPNAYTVYGPNGVVLRDSGSSMVLTLLPGSIQIAGASNSIMVDASGVTINGGLVIATNGTVTINGRVFMQHDHSGVQTGGGVTGPVV